MDPLRQTADEVLRAIAGPDAQLRPGQWEAIDALVNQQARVLLVQRTGFGKSAVYFISSSAWRVALASLPPTTTERNMNGEPTLYDGLISTRAIRRFLPDDIPDDDLGALLFAATRAPSGHNQQPFRFIVVRRTPETAKVREALTRGFQEAWSPNRQEPADDDTSRRARMARTMSHFVDHVGEAPVIVFACIDHHVGGDGLVAGASVFPACQNLLLAARARGYGGVMTNWHRLVTDELDALLGLPEHVSIAATIPLGRPVGGHGPVRRRPLPELVFENRWDEPAPWAVDPPGTRYTRG